MRYGQSLTVFYWPNMGWHWISDFVFYDLWYVIGV